MKTIIGLAALMKGKSTKIIAASVIALAVGVEVRLVAIETKAKVDCDHILRAIERVEKQNEEITKRIDRLIERGR